MFYIVTGMDRVSAKRVRVRIDASSREEAMRIASQRGIAAESCEAEPSGAALDEIRTAAEAESAHPHHDPNATVTGTIITEALVARALNVVRKVLTETLFASVARVLKLIGDWGSLVAAGLGAALCLVLAVKTDSFNQALIALAWVFAVVVLQFIGSRFIGSCDTMGRQTPCRMATTAFFDCFALLVLIGAVGFAVFGVYTGIRTKAFEPVIVGSVYLFIGIMLASLSLHPRAMQVEVANNTGPGEEAIGIFTFLFKLLLKAAPVFYGVLTAVGCVMLAWGIIGAIREDFAAVGLGLGAMPLIAAGLLAPFVLYVVFLVYYLLIDVLRAVLALPAKLDRLIEK